MSEGVTARPVSESQSERSEIIFPNDANAIGNLFGGRLMQFIDLAGAMAASRHARAYTVTASMDHLDFVAPVKVGDLLILRSSVADLDGGRRQGDGGGRSRRALPPRVVGVPHVCSSRRNGQGH